MLIFQFGARFSFLTLALITVYGKLDTQFTLQSTWGRLHLSSTGADTVIRCTSYDSDPSEMRFGRVMDAGHGIDLPPFYREFGSQQPPYGRALHMGSINGSMRFGAYFCEEKQDNELVQITTLKLPPFRITEIDPAQVYKVVNIGDNVTLSMKEWVAKDKTILWLRNGTDHLPEWDNQLVVTISNVTKEHQGVYECYYDGERSQSLHGIMRLIVRDCPANLYGATCNNTCLPCYNGGMCHDVTGDCICPAGFTGAHCERACGGNKFGADCEQICYKQPAQFGSIAEDFEAGCKFFLFCKLDPYGCSCAPGFNGSMCDTDCEAGFYGPDCSQKCHCMDGLPCHKITGKCQNSCDRGWFGSSCQIFRSETLSPNITFINNNTINVGANTDILCTADGFPAPELKLLYSNGSEIIGAVLKKNITSSMISTIISIDSSGPNSISCTAANKYGTDETETVITVVDPPMLLTKPLLVNRTANSLSLQWFSWHYGKDFGGIPGDTPMCKPVYKKKSASVWIHSAMDVKKNASVIDNLQSNTEYNVSILCKRDGKDGVGSPGPEAVFKTACGEATPESAVVVQVTNITSSSISLKWNEPNSNYLKCSVIGYLLIYRLSSDRNSSKAVELNSRNSTSYEIESLLPFTKYIIKIKTKTSRELTKYPGRIILFTSESVPGKVGNIRKEYTPSYDKVVLSWSEPRHKNGIIIYYKIKYVLVNEGMCGEISNKTDLEKISILNSVMLENLRPYSNYQIFIGATTKVGLGPIQEYRIMTLQSVPSGYPKNLQLIKVLATSFEVIWDAVPCLERNGRIVTNEYEIARDSTSLVRKGGSLLRNTTGNRAYVDNLLPNTEYKVRVRQYTESGSGPFSPYLFKKTSVSVPDIPELRLSLSQTTFLVLNWTKPSARGPVAIYELQHRLTNATANVAIFTVFVEVQDLSAPILTHKFEGLTPATYYSFRIRAENSAGRSNWSPLFNFRTLVQFGRPPSNLSLTFRRFDMLGISWQPPSSSISATTGFLIQFQPVVGSADEVNPATEIVVSGDIHNTTLNNLAPDTNYSVAVSTLTKGGVGGSVAAIFKTSIEIKRTAPFPIVLTEQAENQSVPMKFEIINDTDVPRIFEIIIGKGNHIDLDEKNLLDFYNASQMKVSYYITAKISSYNFGEQLFVIGDGQTYEGYENVELVNDILYTVWIRAVYVSKDGIIAVLSPPGKQIYLEGYVGFTTSIDTIKVFGIPLLLLILLILGCLIILFITTFVIAYMIRRYQLRNQSKPYCVSKNVTSGSWNALYEVPETQMKDEEISQSFFASKKSSKLKKKKNSKASGIPIKTFPQYVKMKSESHGDNFLIEFKMFESDQLYSWQFAKKPENVSKNRYGNVLPYDHSRVILNSKGQNSDEDYINANYVDGVFKKREYIVTQGPKPNTASDFWKMVWQEKSPAIIMLTDLSENNKPKCYQYWPDDSQHYGEIQVMQIHKEECSEYRIHTFLLRKPKLDDTRRVVLYRYLGWSEQDIPKDVTMLLRMQRRFRNDLSSGHGPIVVHCSTGVGRAGTFVAIDAVLKQAAIEQRVDIFNYVKKIRSQRMNLVQTDEQYIFVHEAILEGLLAGDTQVQLEDLPIYFNSLNVVSETGETKLQQQYSMIMRAADRQFQAGSRVSFLPFIDDDTALELPDTVFVSNHESRKAYLVTKMPSSDCAIEFWNMVYKHKSNVIVMLNELKLNARDEVSSAYWPQDGHEQYGHLEVQVVTSEIVNNIHLRTMKIINTKCVGSPPHVIIHLQYFDWPEDTLIPKTAKSIVALINLMYKWFQRTNSNGPITIHCRDGVSQSGLICAIANIKQEMDTSGSVDVFSICKRLCSAHVDFLSTMEQYKFCYEVALYIYNTNSVHA